MHVTVEDRRATAVKGDPDHPITHGFLCGKVSNYLDRVYSDERILHPLVREDGEFRRATWDEALDVAAAGLRRALAPEVRNRIRFEMKREVKRSRKQRKADMKQARREWEARQRAAIPASEVSR